MPRKHTTIEEWLEEQFADEEKADKPITGLTLLHATGMGGGKSVYELDLGNAKRKWTAKDLAVLFRNKAETHGEPFGGLQTFHLLLYRSGLTEAAAMLPFNVVEGELAAGEMSHVRERADSTGITQQLMRHVEKTNQLLVGFVQGFGLQAMQDRLALQKELNECYQVIRELFMDRAKGDHEMKMSLEKFRRETEERTALMRHVPALINMATGSPVLPVASVDSAIVEALARKVTPEMLDQLSMLGFANAEELVGIKARFKQIRDEDEAKVKALEKAPAASNELETTP